MAVANLSGHSADTGIWLAQHFSEGMSRCGPFEASPVLAIAVSGGSDSMALCLLAQHWAEQNDGRIVALTVDHGLRTESAKEAAQVSSWLAQYGVEHHTLRLNSLAATNSNLQALARNARYAAMGEWCRQHGVLHLLVAHHQEDQAETLLLRLGRGSGVDGLSAMPYVSELPFVRLLRPLLDIPRNTLFQHLSALHQPWVEDPSNQNMLFARNRIRRLLPELAEEGITSERLARTAHLLGEARHALERDARTLMARSVALYPQGFAYLDTTFLQKAPAEVALRVLAATISTLSGEAYKPRLDALSRLYAHITQAAPKTRNFGGCVFTAERKTAGRILTRELNAVKDQIEATHAGNHLWDKRFLLSITPAQKAAGQSISQLGQEGWNQISEHFPTPPLPKKALYALPAVWGLERVLAVPHINYRPEKSAAWFSVRFCAVKPLAGTPFYGNTLMAKQ